MKKGLLSLLALALTVVGCQNYDDQFAELTELIEGVQADVDGLSDLQSDVDALAATISGLATAAELSNLSSAVSDNGSAIAAQDTAIAGLATSSDLTTGLDNLQSQIDALVASLADVADADDIAAINAELSAIQEDLDELLEANAVINQNITINNMATLQYVESLISTATDDPNVIINGAVTISINDTDFDGTGELDRVNAVSAKIATILGDGGAGLGFDFDNTTASHSVDFSNLAFIDDDADFDGKATFAALRTISGFLDHNINGPIDLSGITSCATLTITDGSAVTSVNLGELSIDGGASTAGTTDGHFTFLAATSVDLGKAVTAKVSSPLATAVTVKANTSSVTVETVAEDAQVTIEGTTAEISITGTATSDVFAPNVATNTEITTNDIASLHLVAMTKAATITSGAAAVDFSALTSNASGTITLNKLAGAFTAEDFDVTKTLQVSGTSVSIGTVSNTGSDLIVAPNATTVVVNELDKDDDFELNNTNLPAVTTLTVNGATTAGSTGAAILAFDSDLTVTGHTKLVTLNIDGYLNDVVIENNTKLANLDVDGFMNSLDIDTNAELAAVTLDHDHIEGADASYLTVLDNAKLATLTTNALTEAGDITIAGNTVLTRVDLTSIAAELPVAGAYTISITNNRLTGDYTAATAGSTTTQYVESIVKLDDMQDLRALNTADLANTAVSYDIHVEGDWMTLAGGTATATLGDRISADSAHSTDTMSSGVLTGSYLTSAVFAVTDLLQDE